MAVRIRMKKMGRTHRPFFRICAMDSHSPRDGKAIEELGYYDPMVRDTDARCILKSERVDYWLSVGAQPTPKVGTLIKKYGTDGTHVAAQQEALERIAADKGQASQAAIAAAKQAAEKEAQVREEAEAEKKRQEEAKAKAEAEAKQQAEAEAKAKEEAKADAEAAPAEENAEEPAAAEAAAEEPAAEEAKTEEAPAAADESEEEKKEAAGE